MNTIKYVPSEQNKKRYSALKSHITTGVGSLLLYGTKHHELCSSLITSVKPEINSVAH